MDCSKCLKSSASLMAGSFSDAGLRYYQYTIKEIIITIQQNVSDVKIGTTYAEEVYHTLSAAKNVLTITAPGLYPVRQSLPNALA